METGVNGGHRQIDPHFKYPPGVIPIWQFAIQVLGLKLYRWQALVLEALGQGMPVALAAANGSGKTRYIVAPAILWLLYYFPRGLVPVTSGSWTQLEMQLWPCLLEHRSKFPQWGWYSMRIRTKEGGRMFLFSTNDNRRAEGNHGTADAPCLYIIDEGKSVEDGIYVASDRCTAQFRLISSSTGGPFGRFFECFHSLGFEYYQKRVRSEECPHLLEKFERDKRIYPSDDPDFLSMHFSEFMDEDGPGMIISQSTLRACLDAEIKHAPARRAVYCDFAAGGDENVIAMADGNKVDLIRCWRDTDPIRACKDFINEFVRLKLVPAEIWGDECGLGIVMIQYMAEMGWPIRKFNNGFPARDEEHYCNVGSEIWYSMAKRIIKRQVILPNDSLFFRQATNRRRDYDTKMRLLTEPKERMAERGAKSPDRAEACFSALYVREWGGVTMEQLKGSYIPPSQFVYPMKANGLSFGPDEASQNEESLVFIQR
jgi:hypothetical protein